jgi:hypothetical protein
MRIPLILYSYAYTFIHIGSLLYLYAYILIYHYDYIWFWTIIIYCYRNRTIVFGLTWYMISGILIIICFLVIISFIPFYLPNHSGNMTTSTSTKTRMLSLTSIFHLTPLFFKTFQWPVYGCSNMTPITQMIKLVPFYKPISKH